MRVIAGSLFLGVAAAAIAPQQKILQAADELRGHADEAYDAVSEKTSKVPWTESLHHIEDLLKSSTADARSLWDDVSHSASEVFDSLKSSPKPHSRRHDSEWDHITSGRDIQNVWVENANGEQEREVDGRLEAYSMRTKKVDPKLLGVDSVKQYSGYLDDDEEDKHLFYCKLLPTMSAPHGTNIDKGSSSHATTLRMIQSYFGSTADPAAPL